MRLREFVLAATAAALLSPVAGASANPLQPSGWQVARADQTGEQIALSCPAPSWCMSVGPGGTQIWNGTTWTSAASSFAASFSIRGLSCWSRQGCIVVGSVPRPGATGDEAGKPHALRWDGTSWHPLRVPAATIGDTAFNGISCATRKRCMVVGDLANHAYLWRNGTWTTQRIPKPRGTRWIHGYAIDCATATSCQALGEVGFATPSPLPEYALLSWNGRGWRTKVMTGVHLSTISCATTRSCVAVGEDAKHMIGYAWNGSAWRKSVVPDSPNKYDNAQQEPNGYEQLTGVSCWSATGCQAVGVTNTAPFHRRWNGSSWSSLANPGSTDGTGSSGQASYDVSGIACYDASFCVSAGEVTYGTVVGRTYMERYRP